MLVSPGPGAGARFRASGLRAGAGVRGRRLGLLPNGPQFGPAVPVLASVSCAGARGGFWLRRWGRLVALVLASGFGPWVGAGGLRAVGFGVLGSVRLLAVPAGLHGGVRLCLCFGSEPIRSPPYSRVLLIVQRRAELGGSQRDVCAHGRGLPRLLVFESRRFG